MLKQKIVGGFPLNFERWGASRQLLLSGRGRKKSWAINKINKTKQDINILILDRYHQSNKRKLGKKKQVKNPDNLLCSNNAWEKNTEMKIASGIV